MASKSVTLTEAGLAGDERIETPLGVLELEHGYPTDATSALLFDAMDAQRAAQVYVWSLPLVSFTTWRDEQARVYEAGGFGDYVVFEETATMVQIDERATWFYEAVTSTKGMVNPTPGKGQVYMTTKRDSRGELLRADTTYRLHVAAQAPAAQFWSLTLYSENTRRAYDNGGTSIRSASIDSRDERHHLNPDGSTDLYVGPAAPPSAEDNWLKTVGQDGWFVYFRLYAPTQPFFDRTWSLPDFEAIEPG
jgi:hypothetical protein